MSKQTILVALLCALGGTGAALGASRPAPPPPARATPATPPSAVVDVPRISIALEDWLAGLGVLPPHDQQIQPPLARGTGRPPATLIDRAIALPGLVSSWVSGWSDRSNPGPRERATR